MNYAKPEIAVLGDAARVITGLPPKASPSGDGGSISSSSAYDLDE